MNRKKIILIVLAIIFIIAGIITYFKYFHKAKTEITIPKKEIKITKISEEKMFFPVLSEDEQAIYYLKKENDKGNLYQYLLQKNQSTKLSNFETTNPFDVIWSADQVIIKTNKYSRPMKIMNSSGILNYLINLKKQKMSELNPNLGVVSFSPDGKIIAYQYYDWKNKINNISISNPDGSGWRKLIDGNTDDYELVWLDNENFIYLEVPTDPGGGYLYQLSLKNNTTTSINKDDRYNEIIFNSKKNNLLYEFYQNKKLYLGIMNLDGSNKKDLNLEATIQKIVVLPSGDEMIVATRNQGEYSDKFYRVDLNSGGKTELNFQSQDTIQAFNLIAATDGKTVYFISNDLLYKLEL